MLCLKIDLVHPPVDGGKVGLVSLFNGISTFAGYSMPKLFF